MLIPPLDETIRVPSVIGVAPGSSGHGEIDLGQLHEDLKALEAHGRESNVTKAKFLAELRPIRTVGGGAVGTALSGVVGAASRLALR